MKRVSPDERLDEPEFKAWRRGEGRYVRLPSRTMLHRDTSASTLRAASEGPGWGMQPLNAVGVRSVRSEVIAGPELWFLLIQPSRCSGTRATEWAGRPSLGRRDAWASSIEAPVRYNTAVPTPFDDAAIACVAPDTRQIPSASRFLTDVGSLPDMREGDLPDVVFAS